MWYWFKRNVITHDLSIDCQEPNGHFPWSTLCGCCIACCWKLFDVRNTSGHFPAVSPTILPFMNEAVVIRTVSSKNVTYNVLAYKMNTEIIFSWCRREWERWSWVQDTKQWLLNDSSSLYSLVSMHKAKKKLRLLNLSRQGTVHPFSEWTQGLCRK